MNVKHASNEQLLLLARMLLGSREQAGQLRGALYYATGFFIQCDVSVNGCSFTLCSRATKQLARCVQRCVQVEHTCYTVGAYLLQPAGCFVK